MFTNVCIGVTTGSIGKRAVGRVNGWRGKRKCFARKRGEGGERRGGGGSPLCLFKTSRRRERERERDVGGKRRRRRRSNPLHGGRRSCQECDERGKRGVRNGWMGGLEREEEEKSWPGGGGGGGGGEEVGGVASYSS